MLHILHSVSAGKRSKVQCHKSHVGCACHGSPPVCYAPLIMSAIKFLQKTVKLSAGASFVALASILAVLSMPSEAAAATQIQINPVSVVNNNTASVNFTINTASFQSIPWADFRRIAADNDLIYNSSNCGFGVSIGTNLTGSQTFNINNAPHLSGPCAASGTYYTQFFKWVGLNGSQDQSVNSYYLKYYWNQSTGKITLLNTSGGEVPISNTKFTNIEVTGTSTIKINALYFIDPSEVDTNVSALNPSMVRYQWSLRPTSSTAGQSENVSSYNDSFTRTTLPFLADGVYDLVVSFSNVGCALGSTACPFSSAYIYSDFTITNGSLTSIGTPEFYDATTFLSGNTKYVNCSITQLSGCLINSMSFLFIPPQTSFNSLVVAKQEIEKKAPFIYVVQASSLIPTIFKQPASSLPTISIPFMSGTVVLFSHSMVSSVPYVPIIRGLIAMGIYITLLFGLYKMALGIHDKNQNV